MIEAARIDGANPVQMFFRIKLPYLLSVQGPSLVTDFVRNVNNFNVIYLLTQDVFVTNNQQLAQSNAKEIDLLVTAGILQLQDGRCAGHHGVYRLRSVHRCVLPLYQ